MQKRVKTAQKATKKNEGPKGGKKFTSEYQPSPENKSAGKISARMLTDIMRNKLNEEKELIVEGIDVETGEKRRVKLKRISGEILVMALLNNAAKGKEKSLEMVWDRIEGKAVQPVEDITPPMEQPDLSGLSHEELKIMAKIHKKIKGGV